MGIRKVKTFGGRMYIYVEVQGGERGGRRVVGGGGKLGG